MGSPHSPTVNMNIWMKFNENHSKVSGHNWVDTKWKEELERNIWVKFRENCLKASIFSDYSGDVERMLGTDWETKKTTLFRVGAASAPKTGHRTIYPLILDTWSANRFFGKQWRPSWNATTMHMHFIRVCTVCKDKIKSSWQKYIIFIIQKFLPVTPWNTKWAILYSFYQNA